jgi:hypothetical protein
MNFQMRFVLLKLFLIEKKELFLQFLASLGLPIMKKPDANPVDQVEVDQEAAQLVRFEFLFFEYFTYDFVVG